MSIRIEVLSFYFIDSTVSPDITSKALPQRQDEVIAEKNAIISAMQQELIRAETANIAQENTITTLCDQIDRLQQQLEDFKAQLITKERIVSTLVSEAKSNGYGDEHYVNGRVKSNYSNGENHHLMDTPTTMSSLKRSKLIKQHSFESMTVKEEIILTISPCEEDAENQVSNTLI